MIATAFVAVAAAAVVPLGGTTIHVDAGHNGANATRPAQINRAHADLALSIHADGGAPGGRGFHVIAPLARRAVAPVIVAPSLRFARQLRARLEAIGLLQRTVERDLIATALARAVARTLAR